jgi:5-methylcytosine-specific restriction endonuclease McrA
MPTTAQRGYAGRWPKVRLAILYRDCWRCHWCGGRADQVDHVVPVSAGGARRDPRNLVASCKRCNVRRAREREGRARRAWQRPPSSEPRRIWRGAIDERV